MWIILLVLSSLPWIAHFHMEFIRSLEYSIFIVVLVIWLITSFCTFVSSLVTRDSIVRRNLYILIATPLFVLNLAATYSVYKQVSDSNINEIALQNLESDVFYLSETQSDTAVFNGSIGSKSVDSFIELTNSLSISRVVIGSSTGGIIGSALQLAGLFDELKLEVVVEKFCVSSCVILATSGRILFTTEGALFGFHSSAPVGNVSDSTKYFTVIEGNKLMSSALKRNGFSDEILAKISTTSSDSMYYVTGYQLIDENLAQLFVE